MPKQDHFPNAKQRMLSRQVREIKLREKTEAELRALRRRPKRDGGEPIPAVPPHGPLPLVGGAAALLE